MRRPAHALAAAAALTTLALAALESAPAFADEPLRLAVAGDIACSPSVLPLGVTPTTCQEAGTADLVQSLNPDAVAIPGDIQYDVPTLSEFLGSFDPTWGAFKQKILPAAGNHEYNVPSGAGYYDYFNGVGVDTGQAGSRSLGGYYSVDLTDHWHLITLNSNCTKDSPPIVPVPCAAGSPQETWLKADLAAHRGMCIVAQWHHPLFGSGPTEFGPNNLATRPFWQDLYAAGATLILNGHDHDYQRFAPQMPDGRLDRRHGVREFVLGTGGKSLFEPGPSPAANSEIYDHSTFGVTVFTLHNHSYDWRFVREPSAGNGVLNDHGSAPCNTARGEDRGRREASPLEVDENSRSRDTCAVCVRPYGAL